MQTARRLRDSFRLTYAVSRDFPELWPHFTLVVYAIAVTIFVLLAVLNAALVGYETVTELHPNFNITQSFWFDRFRPGGLGLSDPGTLCDPQTINPGDRFTTNYSLFEWDLVTVKPGPDQAGKSLVYKGSPLQSCDVCAQYMNAHVQEHSADLTTLICCYDLDGFGLIAKTSFSLTMLGGLKYAAPVLGAIPEHVRDMLVEDSRSALLNTMLQHANDDFSTQLDAMLRVAVPTRYPVIISMFIFSKPCPALNLTCEKVSPTEDQGLTVIYSDTSRIDYYHFFRDSTSLAVVEPAPPIKLPVWSPYPAVTNLAHTILAAVQIDLGNPSPSNFLLNRSMVNSTIFDEIYLVVGNSTMYYGISKLYNASANQSAPPLTLDGAATIQSLYSCRLQLAKPIGSAIISVMVATLTMFMSGWAIFIFVSSAYVEGIRGNQPMLPVHIQMGPPPPPPP